jgi:sulfite reductase (NADPH) hemoprotein beta-component
VICASHPKESPIHEQIFAYADKLSQLGLPKTRAYYEIWLDEAPLTNKKEEEDDLYQDRYLPRKFKMAIVIPPNNDVDVFANDLGLIAIIENNVLKGFNVAAGGGLGATHGNASTYPRLATVLGFVDTEEKVLKVAYEIITIQRDYGNRSERKLSRLKYTIDKMGIAAFTAELEKRCGFALEPARPYQFTERVDYFGWQQNHEGKWYYTVFAENGRIMDTETLPLKTALLEVAKTRKANFRFTANQKLILSDIEDGDKALIDGLLQKYGILAHTENAGSMRKNAIACVAMNTCPLALAEGQRYLPTLIGKIEPLLQKHKLGDDAISVRMTGCPNGCGRPYIAEIGFVGTSYGHYNMHLGGDREGTRLNTKYKEGINEESILSELDSLLGLYSKKRKKNETFGDFVIREKIVI